MFHFFAGLFLGVTALFGGIAHNASQVVSHITENTTTAAQVTYTQEQLLSMASDKYANGDLPLGDKKFVTDAPKKGYVYLCHANTDPSGGGAQNAGPWIHGNTWNIQEKSIVSGHIKWPAAAFSVTTSANSRTLTGNDLPFHTTGIFPIASTDPAYKYDKNPNSIKTQSFTQTFPLTPTYSDTPHCMGGEAGIILTGVALFNGFDAGFRDAAAYEVQDSCQGHPQVSGEYHYHSLSSCITDVGEATVIGYALDGFPITGPKVADNKYLTTDNLDECHGLTSQINLDGKQVTMYHYVMTKDFPYSVSCFRGKPVSLQVISGGQGQGQQHAPSGISQQTEQHTMMRPQPPQEAFTACSGKSSGTTCSFTTPNGNVTGTCGTPPGQTSTVCMPSGQGQLPPGQPNRY